VLPRPPYSQPPAVVVRVKPVAIGPAHAVHDAGACVPRPVAASAVAVHVGRTVSDARPVSRGADAQRHGLFCPTGGQHGPPRVIPVCGLAHLTRDISMVAMF
jgi:hypothetical protein